MTMTAEERARAKPIVGEIEQLSMQGEHEEALYAVVRAIRIVQIDARAAADAEWAEKVEEAYQRGRRSGAGDLL